MSAQPVEPLPVLQPIDPTTPAAKAASKAIGELFDDVAERLAREGRPVPDCIA